MKLGLREKLLLIILPLIAGGIFLSVYLAYSNSASATREKIQESLDSSAENLAEQMTLWLDDRLTDVQTWSRGQVYVDALEGGFLGESARVAASEQLTLLSEGYPYLNMLFLCTKEREIVACSSPEGIGKQLTDVPALRACLESGEGVISDGQINPVTKSGAVVFLLHPVLQGEDAGGVLCAAVSLASLSDRFVDRIHLGQSGFAYVADADGRIMAHQDHSRILQTRLSGGQTLKDRAYHRTMVEQGLGRLTYDEDGVQWQSAFATVGGDQGEDQVARPTWIAAVRAPVAELVEGVREAGVLSLIIGVVVTVVIAIVVVLVINGVTRILRSLTGEIDRLSVGDLSHEGNTALLSSLDNRGDELGVLGRAVGSLQEYFAQKSSVADRIANGDLAAKVELASPQDALGRALDMAMDRLSSAVEAIATTAETLTNASSELSRVSESMHGSAAETSQQTNTLMATSEQISGNIQVVASGATEVAASIREISDNANKAAAAANQAVTTVGDTKDTMSKLSVSSGEIGNIINLITDIAQQTNLLALNANIEAARAGEAGRGFGVVAIEVKELASETTKAADDVGRKIEAIQQSAEVTVNANDEISRLIATVNDFQNAVAAAMEQQAGVTSEIGRNVSEVAASVTAVSESITAVAKTAEQASSAAGETQGAAGKLSTLAEDLHKLVGQFRLRARESGNA